MRRAALLGAPALALALAFAGPPSHAAEPGTMYVTAGAVHDGAGEVYAPGAVAIVDGKVTAVGAPSDVAAPPGAERIEAGPDAVVIPGLVAAWTQHASADGKDPATVSVDVRAIDGYDFTRDESVLLAGGVTTVVVSPGSTQVVSGRVAVVKTAGASRDTRLLRAEAGLASGIGDGVQSPPAVIDPPDEPDAAQNPLLPHRNQLPVTRAGAVLILRQLFGGASEGYVADVARGKAPLYVAVDSTGDIEAALAFAGETGVKATLVGARDASAMAPELAESGVSVVLAWPGAPGKVTASDSAEQELARARARGNASALLQAGVPFALTSADDAALPHLLFIAASAAREGKMHAEVALSAVTSNAARIAGVDDRVGALRPGRDGDLVILSGAPTDLRSVPMRTVVDGRVAWTRDESARTTVVRAAEVHLGDGRVLVPGEVAIERGRIVEVGHTVGIPPGARIVDLGSGAVMPGMIDAFAHAGLAGTSGGAGGDLNTAMPAAKAVDAKDPAFALLSGQGITTILAAPGGQGRVAGRASVVKTSGRWPGRRVLREDAGMVMRLYSEGDLKGAKGQLEAALKKARDYRKAHEKYAKDLKEYEAWKKKKAEEEAKRKAEEEKKKKDAEEAAKKKKAEGEDAAAEEKKEEKPPEKKPPEKKEAAKKPEKKEEEKEEPRKPKKDEALEGWAAVLDGKAPLLVQARTVEEIRGALAALGDEKIPLVIVGANDARRVRADLAKAKASVIASPTVLVRDRDGDVNVLRDLALSGLPAAVGSDSYLGGHELRDVLAFAVRGGLAPSAAVKMVTGDAARLLGVGDRVGSIAPGRDADLVLLSAPPFSAGARIVSVYVNGREVRRDAR
jgi:imidazolonepropionase-like amidohydrolase